MKRECWLSNSRAFLEPLVSKIAGGILFVHPRLLVFRGHQMTRWGIALRPPFYHLIAIKFILRKS